MAWSPFDMCCLPCSSYFAGDVPSVKNKKYVQKQLLKNKVGEMVVYEISRFVKFRKPNLRDFVNEVEPSKCRDYKKGVREEQKKC
jgi:hypothetical protein